MEALTGIDFIYFRYKLGRMNAVYAVKIVMGGNEQLCIRFLRIENGFPGCEIADDILNIRAEVIAPVDGKNEYVGILDSFKKPVVWTAVAGMIKRDFAESKAEAGFQIIAVFVRVEFFVRRERALRRFLPKEKKGCPP